MPKVQFTMWYLRNFKIFLFKNDKISHRCIIIKFAHYFVTLNATNEVWLI